MLDPTDYQNTNGINSGVTNYMNGVGSQGAGAVNSRNGNWLSQAGQWLGSDSMSQGMGGIGGGMNNSQMILASDQMGGQLFGILAGQNETTAGNIIKNIPGLSTVGNLINAAFGSHINDEFVKQTEYGTNAIGSQIFKSNTNADVLNDWKNSFQMAHVSKDEVGSDGWFSNKAKNKTNALNESIDETNMKQLMNLGIATNNADRNTDLRILQGMQAAYGGPINSFRKYYDKGGYLSQAKALIRQNEGWREKPYADAPKGKNWRSVGYGFNDSGFREKYPEGISKHYEHGITKKQAEEELDYFLNKAEKQLKSIYGKQWNDFTDSQKAAILDTYYQRPASVGKSSRFYKAVTSGEDAGRYLGVAGFDKRNKIRQGVFGGSQDYVNLGVEIESPSANSSSLQEVTPFTPVVHDLDLAGITPTQAKALELNLASPTFDLSMFGSIPTQQESYVPTVGTVEDFLASYGDFDDTLFACGGKLHKYDGGGWMDFFQAWNQAQGGNNYFSQGNGNWKPSDGLQKNTSDGNAADWLGVAGTTINTLSNWGKKDESLGRGGGYSQFGMAAYDMMKMIHDATKGKRESIDQKLGIPIYARGGRLFANGGSTEGGEGIGAMGYAQIGTAALKLASNAVHQASLDDDIDEEAIHRSINRFGQGFDDAVANVNTNGDLLDLWNNASWMQGNLSARDFRDKSYFDDFLDSYAASWEGFNAGQNFGPWGAAIGAIVGGGSSVIGSIIGRNKASNAADEANRKIEEANERRVGNLLAAAERVDEENDLRILQNMGANGGKLSMGFGLKNPFIMPDGTANPLYKAFGGGLTHGMDWDTGINWVDEGSSHGENPLGGVPMGVDEQGIPNLVEEGEAIWNGDYVFSKRMKVPKKLREKYSLPDDATFADAVAKLTKNSDERPLSSIDRNTQDYILGEFADTQEEMRMAKAQRAMDKQQQLQDDFLMGMQFGLGGHMSPIGIVPDSDNVSLFDKLENSFADGGGIHIDPSKKGTFKAQASKMGMGVQEAASHILAHKENYSPAMVKKANFAKNFAHAFGGSLFDNPFAYGGELGNIFEGIGNKPNSLSIPSTPKDPLRILWEKIGGAKYTDMADATVDKFMEDNLYSHIDDIMGSIAKMSEPQLDKFFSTSVGQRVASFIANSENTGSNAQEAGVNRWYKATGRLARPVQRTVVNAAKRAMAQSKLNARGQMRTPKGGGKPTNVTATTTGKQLGVKGAKEYRAQRDAKLPVVRGSSEVAPVNTNTALATRGSTALTPFAQQATALTVPQGPTWTSIPLWGTLGAVGGGALLDAILDNSEDGVDGVTGAAKVAKRNSSTVGTGTNKSNMFLSKSPVTSNRGKNRAADNSWLDEDFINGIKFTAPEVDNYVASAPITQEDRERIAMDGYNPEYNDDAAKAVDAVTKATIGAGGTSSFKPKQTWTRNLPWMMSGIMGLKEMLTPADYGNANMILDAAYRAGQPISVGTEYIGDYRKRNPFDERYLMNIINQRGAAANRNFMNLSGGNRAVAMSGILANDLTTQMSLAEAARQAYLANRADDAQVAEFNRGTNIFNAQAQNTRNLSLAQLNSQRQNAMLSGIAQGARLRQAIKDQRDAAISANLSAFAQGLGDLGKENGYYNMLGGLNDEGVLNYFYGDDWRTKFNR